jgi:hypothetical protein
MNSTLGPLTGALEPGSPLLYRPRLARDETGSGPRHATSRVRDGGRGAYPYITGAKEIRRRDRGETL